MSITEIVLSVVALYYAIGFGRIVYFATLHEYANPKCLKDWTGVYMIWTFWPLTFCEEFQP